MGSTPVLIEWIPHIPVPAAFGGIPYPPRPPISLKRYGGGIPPIRFLARSIPDPNLGSNGDPHIFNMGILRKRTRRFPDPHPAGGGWVTADSLPCPFDPGFQSGIERGSPYFQYGDSKEAKPLKAAADGMCVMAGRPPISPLGDMGGRWGSPSAKGGWRSPLGPGSGPEGKGKWALPWGSRNISIGRLSALGAGGCGFKSRFLDPPSAEGRRGYRQGGQRKVARIKFDSAGTALP